MELRRAEGGRLLAAILLASCQLCFVAGAPARATDNYVSVCPFVVNPNADLPWEDLTPLPKAPPSSRPPPSPPPRPPPPPPSTSSCPAINANCGGIVPDFIYEPSAEYSGFDSLGATSSSTSAATCGTLCLSKAGCVGFVHNVSSGICSFRTYLASGVAKSGIDTWRRCNLPPPPPVKPSTSTSSPTQAVCGAKLLGYTWKPYQNMQGFDSPLGKSGVASNITTCATVCNAMSECVAFTYDLTSKICYYKSGLGPLVALNRVDTYVKCQGPTTQSGARRRLLAAAALPRWSNPATWPNGVVPGIGAAVGANATIPCGKTVLLDVPDLTLDVLQIQGLLKFLDDPSLPSIYVRANFVLVEGQLFIGTPKQQFRHKATIELTPNTRNGRAHLLFSSTPPADAANPRSLGHKAFVVVGGQVHLHGLPGPASMPVWCRLSKTAVDEDTTITVDADVEGSWPVGAEIAVTSTDYDRWQAETFTIVSVSSTGDGESVIALDKPLKFMHYGKANSLSDGFGGFVDERAEVALLSRNIVITGTEEPAPYELEGGHFMVFFTNSPPQHIEGVEFFKMGQQGTLGRYSIHFHVVGNAPKTVCRKNSINRSKQRCIVIHASHNITVESNVAFNTHGHCFMTEEGGEQDNKFINNLGMLTNPVSQRIMLAGTNPPVSEETDDRPATFWITNPRNTLVGNVAAGSADSGFWFELRGSVRGISLDIPSLKDIRPILQSLGTVSNNVAHSNGGVGMRTYPNGMRPRGATSNDAVPGTISGLLIYKNAYTGMFVHNTDSLTITNSTFADNGFGLHLNQDDKITLANSRMVALTTNYGNPDGCWRSDIWARCRPVSTTICSMPLKWGIQGRSTGNPNRQAPTYGVVIDQSRFGDGSTGNTVKNVRFANYDTNCWTASSIVSVGTSEFWNAAHTAEGLKFADSRPVWMPPRISQVNLHNSISDGGEQAQFYAVYDKDGSIGGSPGYIVANNSQILPPGLKGCTAQPKWNAYACAGACYRTLMISYFEPGFTSNAANANNEREDFSYLQVTRVSDGSVVIVDGNLRTTMISNPVQRHFFMTLLANQVYIIEVVPSTKAPTFEPVNITMRYRDGGFCGQALTLRFKEVAKKPWTLTSTNNVFHNLCYGVAALPSTTPFVTYSPVCISRARWLEVVMGRTFADSVTIIRGTGTDSEACLPNYQCSMLWSANSQWLYDASGLERRPIFYNPVVSFPANWKKGTAPLGFASWNHPYLQTMLPAPSNTLATYYFRQPFTLKSTNCYYSLQIEMIVDDGAVVYLNNQEMIRSNLANGTLSNGTHALSPQDFARWQTFFVPLMGVSAYYLVEGTNTIAVEQHMAKWTSSGVFDMRISGIRKASCSGAKITPEICDGLDNNNNGKVDEAADGKPLTQPCSTPCGTGIATCIKGIFQNCTAIPATEEVCDGKDNDCDGLVDNGVQQMDCQEGFVCSRAKCLPVGNATISQQLWPRNASGWAYYDQGGNLEETNPNWLFGQSIDTWPTGAGPLGFNNTNAPSWEWLGTNISQFTKDGRSMTGYFVKSFNLSPAQLDSTFSIDFSVRRVHGAVIYLNGMEVWRTNMNWGPIMWNTTSASVTRTSEWSPGCCDVQWKYNQCTRCYHNTSYPLRVGTNVIAAELHTYYRWEKVAAFDMDLFRKEILPCPSLPGSPSQCVRGVQQFISWPNSVWKYSDGSLPLPSINWTLPSYDDSDWKSGIAPLGYGSDVQSIFKTSIDNGLSREAEARRAYYFRRTIDVPDASCYFQLLSNLLSRSGAVVYINGVEVYRRNLPRTPLNSTVFATSNGDSRYEATSLAGGWLQTGNNLLAVEVRRSSPSTAAVVFDLQVLGDREAVTCLPAPL